MKNHNIVVLASTVFEVEKKESKVSIKSHKKATSANEPVYHETYY